MELPSRTSAAWSRASLVFTLYGALALLALSIAIARGHPNIYVFVHHRPLWKPLVSPLAGLGFGLAVVLASRYSVHSFGWARRLHHDFRHLLGELREKEIFIIAIASSVGEELFFRGALLPTTGLWWSSAVFALLHIGPGVRYLPWTVSALVLGLAMGLLTVHLGDLGAPIVAHFTINFMNLGHIARTDLPLDR